MKCLILLCLIGVAFAAFGDEHLFDNLVQELMRVLHEMHKHTSSISQTQCKTDCQTQLSLASAMCGELCKLAGHRFHLVDSS